MSTNPEEDEEAHDAAGIHCRSDEQQRTILE
jgi:hypothetical protein